MLHEGSGGDAGVNADHNVLDVLVYIGRVLSLEQHGSSSSFAV